MKPRRPVWPSTLGPNTPLNRREVIARAYRDAALSPDPAAAVANADQLARALGELWLFPHVDTGSEWISLHEFAQLAGRGVEAVRGWYKIAPSWGVPPERRRGYVRRVDAIDYLAARDNPGYDAREAA